MKLEIEKPLFIPLKWPHYWAFANNSKRIEFRTYGPRWNEKTCRAGRKVTLSCGYGKRNRLTGVISGFAVCPKSLLKFHYQLTPAETATLGTLPDCVCACIEIGDIKPIAT